MANASALVALSVITVAIWEPTTPSCFCGSSMWLLFAVAPGVLGCGLSRNFWWRSPLVAIPQWTRRNERKFRSGESTDPIATGHPEALGLGLAPRAMFPEALTQ